MATRLVDFDSANAEVQVGDLDGAVGGGKILAGGGRVEIDGGAGDGIFLKTTSPNGVDVDAKVFLRNLPTSNPGQAGQLWNSGGTLKIS